jgi:RHS repeat-associated protein
MLASSFFDPMLGIDIHWEMVPMPAPVPTPIPNPFTGIVCDFTGLLVGQVLSNAIAAATGGSLKGPVFYWGVIPATNTGTNGDHIPGHILIPPGTSWAPVPKTPKPVVRPGDKPKPPKPVSPDNDAIIVFGSKTVSVLGSNAVRMGDHAMSCSEPVRLPSTVVLAVPKGRPIMIGGPPSLDLAAAVLASLRTRFIGDSLQAGISRLPIGARGRAILSWIACTLTGHPVDVATGKVMTHAVDAELPGPLPLKIERFYMSSFASRSGPLGHGWSCSLDQAVWEELGKVVLLEEDGRELEFDTFDFPKHRMQVGDEVWHPIDRLTLKREGPAKWSVTSHPGVRREFAPVPGQTDGRARIQRIVSRCGFHEIVFNYDKRGRLEWVHDCAGRRILVVQDESNQITALKLPHPAESGWYVHRQYEYDLEGDLISVEDSLGEKWTFEYVTHLMVRETDRTDLSFYFEYDGLGEDAWCTRTWGDGGIYDHVIRYDKQNHVTFVTNSLGHTSQYHLNSVGLVVKVVSPLGATTLYEYDPKTLRKSKQVDPLGHSFTWRHDGQGRETEIVGPDGAHLILTHGRRSLEHAIDSLGAEWHWIRDANSLLLKVLTPAGEVIEMDYERGLPIAIRSSGGRQLGIEYDAQLNIAALRSENGAMARFQFDQLGRLCRVLDPCGAVVQMQHDLEGRTIRVERASGAVERLVWNSEGDLLGFEDPTHSVRYRVGSMHRIVEREVAGTIQRLEFDTEGKLTAVVNEAGERHELRRSEDGYIVRELGFDGVERVYTRDLSGRVMTVSWPSGRRTQMTYDAAGRNIKTSFSEGDSIEIEYNQHGAMVMARTASTAVELVRDKMRRPLLEIQQSHGKEYIVSSSYGPDGLRSGLTTSLGATAAWSRGAFGYVSQIFFRTDTLAQTASHLSEFSSVVRFERDQLGRTLAANWLGGMSVEWTRDIASRPISRRIRFANRQFESRLYKWQGQDHIVSIGDTMEGTTLWEHDNRGRLIGMVAPNGGIKARSLDVVGNVYGRADFSDRQYAPGGRLLAANRVTFEYDADGWPFKKRTATGDWHYKWNGARLLEEVESPSGLRLRFEYDAFARRIRKAIWRRLDRDAEPHDDIRYVWDGNRLLHEISKHGPEITWRWDPDGMTPMMKEVGEQRWVIISDQLGAPTEMFSPNGTLVWKARLDPTGLVKMELGAPEDCPWRYQGQYEDTETSLYYNRYRYYDPEFGRYLSPDPSGLSGGLHPYAYVDDPLVQIDPFGLHIIEAFLDGAAVLNPSATKHPTWWRNLRGSEGNGMAESGFGRAGDSENRLLDFLKDKFGKEGLEGKTLEIHSLGEPGMGWGPLHSCDHCGVGMQNFANEMEMTVIYHGPEGAEPERYSPCGT